MRCNSKPASFFTSLLRKKPRWGYSLKTFMLLAPPLLFTAFALGACENVDMQMQNQMSFKTQEYPRKTNPVGSVPMFGSRVNYEDVEGSTLEPPFPLDRDAAGRGVKLYRIYCAVCHGITGNAVSPVAEKMDLQPFDLTVEDAIELTDGEVFVKILASDSIMPKHRNELSDREAWEITAYVRQLQKNHEPGKEP